MSANVCYIILHPVCISLYFNFNKKKFDKFLSKLDDTACTIYENPLCNRELFLETLHKFVRKANSYTLFYLLFLVSIPECDCILVWLMGLGWFDNDQSFSHPTQFPLEPTEGFGYSISIWFYMLVVAMSLVKRVSFESFIVSLFLYLNFYFNQIGIILKRVFYENLGTPDIELNLKRWIRTHQQIQR